jgi:uncharacterized protein YceK
MRPVKSILLIFIIFISMSGCNTGYNRHNGQWVWTTHDEYNGHSAIPIAGIDNCSFKII